MRRFSRSAITPQKAPNSMGNHCRVPTSPTRKKESVNSRTSQPNTTICIHRAPYNKRFPPKKKGYPRTPNILKRGLFCIADKAGSFLQNSRFVFCYVLYIEKEEVTQSDDKSRNFQNVVWRCFSLSKAIYSVLSGFYVFERTHYLNDRLRFYIWTGKVGPCLCPSACFFHHY